MSADIYVKPGPACEKCGRSGDEQDFNLTYNLSPMLWGAGMPTWREFVGMRNADAGAIWEAVADELEANPVRYSALNPPNGWGTYEGAVHVLRLLVEACQAEPDGRIEAWL